MRTMSVGSHARNLVAVCLIFSISDSVTTGPGSEVQISRISTRDTCNNTLTSFRKQVSCDWHCPTIRPIIGQPESAKAWPLSMSTAAWINWRIAMEGKKGKNASPYRLTRACAVLPHWKWEAENCAKLAARSSMLENERQESVPNPPGWTAGLMYRSRMPSTGKSSEILLAKETCRVPKWPELFWSSSVRRSWRHSSRKSPMTAEGQVRIPSIRWRPYPALASFDATTIPQPWKTSLGHRRCVFRQDGVSTPKYWMHLRNSHPRTTAPWK